MIKNNHGFTLVEMIATVTILGIVTVIAFPVISGIKDGLTEKKFDVYRDAMITASMLYIDAYSEDVFGKEGVKNDDCACYNISLKVLQGKKLISDVGVENASCDVDNSYVSVQRKNNVYTYDAKILCEQKKNGSSYNTYQKEVTEPFSCTCKPFQE